MLMYTGRPLLGGPRYVLPMYPAFLALGGYAARRWSGKQFGFYLGCLGFAEPGVDVGVSELVAGFVNGSLHEFRIIY